VILSTRPVGLPEMSSPHPATQIETRRIDADALTADTIIVAGCLIGNLINHAVDPLQSRG
jgi:hypothetical protein